MNHAAVPSGPAALNLLQPGTAARLQMAGRVSIGLKNQDGSWSVPGVGDSLTAGELWRSSASVTILGERPAWQGQQALGA